MTFRIDSVQHFFDDVLATRYFTDGGPLTFNYEPGESKLVLVTGENATGKSLLRKLIGGALKAHEIESIALSMQGRTSVGTFAGFIYGDESHMATGCNTSGTILTAMSTSRGREKRHAIVWDEPDVGLSDSYAAGAGEEIVEFIKSPPEKLLFAVVTTHRKALLKALLPADPHHIRLGDKMTLERVLTAPIKPKRLEELRERNITLFRRLHKDFGI